MNAGELIHELKTLGLVGMKGTHIVIQDENAELYQIKRVDWVEETGAIHLTVGDRVR